MKIPVNASLPSLCRAPPARRLVSMQSRLDCRIEDDAHNDERFEVRVLDEEENELSQFSLREFGFPLHLVLVLFHPKGLHPLLLALCGEGYPARLRLHAAVLVHNHAHEDVHPEEAAQNDKSDEEQDHVRPVVPLGLLVHLCRIHAHVGQVHPIVHC